MYFLPMMGLMYIGSEYICSGAQVVDLGIGHDGFIIDESTDGFSL
jgi:hypothetical protein